MASSINAAEPIFGRPTTAAVRANFAAAKAEIEALQALVTQAVLPSSTPTFAGLTLGGHVSFNTDNAYDIGASGVRARTGYFGTGVTTPLVTTGNISNGVTAIVIGGNGTQLRIRNDLVAVNFFDVFGAVSGGSVHIRAEGSDTNIPVLVSSKGNASVFIETGQGSRPVAGFIDTANSVNYIQFAGSATGGAVVIQPIGSDSSIQLNIKSKGAANMVLGAGGASDVQMYTNLDVSAALVANFKHVASAVNHWDIYGSTTGNDLVAQPEGTDTNVGVQIRSKGTGGVTLLTGQGARVTFKAVDTASSVNFLQTNPGATGNAVGLYAVGTDTNVGLTISSQGTGGVILATALAAHIGLQIIDVASAVNWVVIKGAPTLGGGSIGVGGSDADIGLYFSTKGVGSHFFYTNSQGVPQFGVVHTASVANYVQATGAASGANASLKASAENLLFGSGSALATTATAGYVMIPSCAGTPTGVPTGQGAGKIPMQFDTTGVKLWFYTGGAWKGVVVA